MIAWKMMSRALLNDTEFNTPVTERADGHFAAAAFRYPVDAS
jgi:hypothetical protein